jgi:dipeptidyl aminopeptidase/acylaminoacyl peptidase
VRTLPLVTGVLAAAMVAGVAGAQEEMRPLDPTTFVTLDQVRDVQISPDGAWVAYTLVTTDTEADARTSDVWMVATGGGDPVRVSDRRAGGRGARWSPDGSALAYVTARGGAEVRVYRMARRSARRLVRLSTGASGLVWSADGQKLAFTSRVYPDCPDETCQTGRLDAAADGPVVPRVYEELPYRAWDVWDDERRGHVFVIDVEGGEPTDLMAGLDWDVAGGAYAFSADGEAVILTAKIGADRAWHTNSDLFRIPVAGGEPRNLTADMPGAERAAAPSPDGTKLAFLSQERAGFESDRWRLVVRDLASGRRQDVTRRVSLSVREFRWLPDGSGLVFTAQQRQRTGVFRVDLDARVSPVSRWGNVSGLSIAADSAMTLAFANDAIDRPAQVFVRSLEGDERPRALTDYNAERLEGVALAQGQEISWVGADGQPVYGLLVRPPTFRRGERYPLVVMIHGGPQGAWLDAFHPRWNAQLFAAPGYVTVLLNPRGSTGFGQRFVDQISRDWGGRVYIDLMAGVEHATRFAFVDSSRIAAAGGSFGGYMVNWINGHSNRFDALITHAGLYNLESFYGATEELFFPEWEFAAPPWDNRTYYDQWSPHRYAQNFRTPTLVLHGALDYRVPDTQAFEAFTALRRQDVPARLVYFPDEGHWIGRPSNQVRWWEEVHGWLAQYLGATATP